MGDIADYLVDKEMFEDWSEKKPRIYSYSNGNETNIIYGMIQRRFPEMSTKDIRKFIKRISKEKFGFKIIPGRKTTIDSYCRFLCGRKKRFKKLLDKSKT